MTITEAFERIMQNHGTNYKVYAVSRGHAVNFYLLRWRRREVMGDKFLESMTDFGCKVYATNGKGMIPLEGLFSGFERIPVWSVIATLKAVGFSLVVVDGDESYTVDSSADFSELTDLRRKYPIEESETQ